LTEGRVEAPNEDQAVEVLHRKELVILSLEPTEKPVFSKDIFSFLSRPSRKDLVIFTRQMATMIDADVPMIEGLRTLAGQVAKDSFRKIVENIALSIEGGASLSSALANHERFFGSFYISLVKTGEVSGKLHSTLGYLADYLEKNAALTSKIKGALFYPAFVFFAIVIVSLVVVTVVLPKLLAILKEAGAENLPLSTKILINITNFVNNYFIFLLILMIISAIGFVGFIKSEGGRRKWDNFKLNAPQFKTLVRSFYLARVCETLATLIKAGVPILDGLKISSEVVGNKIYEEILTKARESVQGGGTMSEVFREFDEFPPLVTSMVTIGEKTGRTDFMLDNAAKFYKTESENMVQNLTQLIEPILILLLGLAVGVLVSAVLLPIYSLVGAF